MCSRLAGGEERSRRLLLGRCPEGEMKRERTSGKDVVFVQAKGGVVNIASGYTFMIGKVVSRFRVKPYASY